MTALRVLKEELADVDIGAVHVNGCSEHLRDRWILSKISAKDLSKTLFRDRTVSFVIFSKLRHTITRRTEKMRERRSIARKQLHSMR